MYQAVEAIVKQGRVVPCEPFPLEESARFLLIPLPIPQPVLSREERLAAFEASLGQYRDHLSSVDEFIARKKEEKALEEQ